MRQTTSLVKQKNPAAVTLGRLGGLKGGRARADSLTPEKRKAIAKKAAKARWANKAQIDEIERAMLQEHQRDLEAFKRLRRFLPENGAQANGSVQTHIILPPMPGLSEEEESIRDSADELQGVVTLRGTIGRMMAGDPKQGMDWPKDA